jgi:two-component system cell cycle sensor histidine kinase/response regulator CckA
VAEGRATLAHVRDSDERLRRAQKMEVVGQLAAGVAHNFNNLLQVTMGYTDILMDARHDGEIDLEAIGEIRKATERGASLTRQLLAFGRKHDPRAVRVDLDVTIAAMQEMLRRVIREDIELTLALDSDGAAVTIDPFDLEQVVFNLVINARDALPEGGAIGIALSRVTIDGTNRPKDQAVVPGAYAKLDVRDNGTGMDADVRAHLFEPFFTTKEVGQGTGLGLAFVDGIARHGGGFVTVDTTPGQGTTVSIHLPLVPELARAGATGAGRTTTLPVQPAATILLVEDEDAVRFMTAHMLTRAGYHVLAASGPEDAIAIFELHADRIDLLLTDVVMPGMHGPELAGRLAARRPDLPVVFVSGYSDQMPPLAVVSSRAAFVPKPFTASNLISTLQGVLASGVP